MALPPTTASSDLSQQTGGPGFQEPTVAPPIQPPASAPQAPPAQDTTPQTPSQDTGGGGGFWSGGLFGVIDHTAHAVTNVVTKSLSKVPGLSAVGNALNRVYTDVVSHPLSTFLTMGNEADYRHAGIGFFFKSSNWVKSWQAANNISPGQAVVTGLNNGGIGFGPMFGATKIDPLDPNAIHALVQRNSLAAISSGGMDLATRTFLDPTSLAAKGLTRGAQELKNAPVHATSDIEAKVTGRAGARLTEQILKNNATSNPLARNLRLQAVKNSSQSYSLAAAYTAAGGDLAKVQELQRLAEGDISAYDRIASDTETLGALHGTGPGPTPLTLHQNLPAVNTPAGALIAMRASAQFMPADIELKSALSAMPPEELDNWLQVPSKMKTAHAASA
jgi:hypothetical protein